MARQSAAGGSGKRSGNCDRARGIRSRRARYVTRTRWSGAGVRSGRQERPHAAAQVVGDRGGLESREVDDTHGPRSAQSRLARDASGEREIERAFSHSRHPQIEIEELTMRQARKNSAVIESPGTRRFPLHHEFAAEGAIDSALEPVLERRAEQIEKARIEYDAGRSQCANRTSCVERKAFAGTLPS